MVSCVSTSYPGHRSALWSYVRVEVEVFVSSMKLEVVYKVYQYILCISLVLVLRSMLNVP